MRDYYYIKQIAYLILHHHNDQNAYIFFYIGVILTFLQKLDPYRVVQTCLGCIMAN